MDPLSFHIISSILMMLAWLPECPWGRVVIYPEDPYSQEMSQPGFTPEEEPVTDLNIEEFETPSDDNTESAIPAEPVSPIGTILAENDMILTPDQYHALYSKSSVSSRKKRKAIRRESYRWPNGEIPYEFAHDDFNALEVYRIKEAMQDWEDHTCLKFRPANSRDVNRIRFQAGRGGCTAALGRIGGTQPVNLYYADCRWSGVYRHELGHAIGLVHEHQRPDRDSYITIVYDNVKPGKKRWFNTYSPQQVNMYGVTYDYNSVMHYGIKAFSKDYRSQTIFTKDPKNVVEIGMVYWKGLSFSDIKIVNLMYQCNKNCTFDPKCKAPGFLDKNCSCVCPANTDCGLGVLECDNVWTGTMCDTWAEKGECVKHEKWMNKHCRKACGLCPKDCPNQWPDDKCDYWAKVGACTINPSWMRVKCSRSCRSCPGSCMNLWDDTKCKDWATSGFCKNTYSKEWMNKNCVKACKACRGQETMTSSND